METPRLRSIAYKVFKTLNYLTPNVIRNVLSLYMFNLQEIQSSCSFAKGNKIWKEKIQKLCQIIYPILRSAVNPNKTGLFEGSFPLTLSYFKKNLLISTNI